MAKSNRAHIGHLDKRQPSGRSMEDQPSHIELPRFAIGRKISLIDNDAFRWPTAIAEYVTSLNDVKENKSIGRAVAANSLFVQYISPHEMSNMLGAFVGGMTKGRRRHLAPRRLQREIGEGIRDAQSQEGFERLQNLERVVRDHIQASDDEPLDSVQDPGPFNIWGESVVRLRRQLVMINDYTIGAKVVESDVADSYSALKAVLTDVGLDTRSMDPNEWKATFPLFKTYGQISTSSEERSPVLPRHPGFVVLSPLKIVEVKSIDMV